MHHCLFVRVTEAREHEILINCFLYFLIYLIISQYARARARQMQSRTKLEICSPFDTSPDYESKIFIYDAKFQNLVLRQKYH